MKIDTTQNQPNDRPKSFRAGMVGQTAQDLAKRAREWRQHAQEAEGRLALWCVRGESQETRGAIMRAREWALCVRQTAECYRVMVASLALVRSTGPKVRPSPTAISVRIPAMPMSDLNNGGLHV